MDGVRALTPDRVVGYIGPVCWLYARANELGISLSAIAADLKGIARNTMVALSVRDGDMILSFPHDRTVAASAVE